METLNIGLINSDLVLPRGGQKQLCYLAYYLKKFGHDVTIYTYEKKKPYIYDSLIENIEIKELGVDFYKPHKVTWGEILLRYITLSKKLSQLISKNHDIINPHCVPSQLVMPFLKTKNAVWMCNEPMIWNYFSWKFSQILPIFWIYALDKCAVSWFTKVCMLDKKMEKIVNEHYSCDTCVVGSAVDWDVPVHHIENDFFDVFMVGAAGPQKRPIDIIKAVSELPQNIKKRTRVILVGNTHPIEYKMEMHTIANKNSVNLIHYDEVTTKQLRNLYAVADVSLFVPELQPWGIFPLESILAGVPVIISDQCGVTDILRNFNVPIVSTGNISDITKALIDMLENREKYLRCLPSIQEFLKNNYTWEKYTYRMVDIYKKVLVT